MRPQRILTIVAPGGGAQPLRCLTAMQGRTQDNPRVKSALDITGDSLRQVDTCLHKDTCHPQAVVAVFVILVSSFAIVAAANFSGTDVIASFVSIGSFENRTLEHFALLRR